MGRLASAALWTNPGQLGNIAFRLWHGYQRMAVAMVFSQCNLETLRGQTGICLRPWVQHRSAARAAVPRPHKAKKSQAHGPALPQISANQLERGLPTTTP